MRILRLTTAEAAKSIHRQYGGKLVPIWKMRRVVDSLEQREAIEVQRMGLFRTVADCDLKIIADELRRTGWFNAEVAAC